MTTTVIDDNPGQMLQVLNDLVASYETQTGQRPALLMSIATCRTIFKILTGAEVKDVWGAQLLGLPVFISPVPGDNDVMALDPGVAQWLAYRPEVLRRKMKKSGCS